MIRKLTSAYAIIFAFCSFMFFESIYSINIYSIDGKNISLGNYKGKKILFLIVPVSISDTNISINEILAFQKKYPSVTIVGVPAADAGLALVSAASLKSLFKDFGPSLVLTENMNVKKSSGSAQAALFQWLTHKDRNSHFDNDVRAIGQKFFVNERGELYAAIGPEIKLSNPGIDRIISTPVRN